MEDPTLPDISFLQNAPFSCRFLGPSKSDIPISHSGSDTKMKKTDKISKLLFRVWKTILKIPIYLSTCLSIGWCTTFITFVSWSCPFSFFSTHFDQRPASHSPPLSFSPSHSSQSSAKTPPGPRRPSPASDLIKALSGTSDPFFCVNIGWIFKM